MMRLTGRLMWIIACVLVFCIGAVRTGYGLAFPMEEAGVFAMSDCELPCWMGLEEGVTGATEIQDIIASYELLNRGYWDEYRVHEHLRLYVQYEEVLDDMHFVYTGCPLQVATELGRPDLIQVNGTSDKLYFAYENGVTLTFQSGGYAGNLMVYPQHPTEVVEYIEYNMDSRLNKVLTDRVVDYWLLADCEW